MSCLASSYHLFVVDLVNFVTCSSKEPKTTFTDVARDDQEFQ
jgi:hypothetical protein